MADNTTLPAGVIITWVPSGNPIKFQQLQDALENSGLDRALAKSMAPSNAFARAAKQMCENRVIDRIKCKIADRNGLIKFQFTGKSLSNGELEYAKECVLHLDKATGEITCSNAELAALAERLVSQHMEQRLPADITRLIQKIFESKGGDLVPIRKQGGCYFVPHTHLSLLGPIDALLKEIGGELDQWTIPSGNTQTNNTIAKNMAEHLFQTIAKWKETVKLISEKSSTAVLMRRMQEARELRLKMKSYHALIGGFEKQLHKELFSAEETLIQNAHAAKAS